MTLGELIQAARDEARDHTDPLGGTNAEYIRWANQAEREACRRARLITDSTTVEDAQDTPQPVCVYDLALNQALITLHPSILFVRDLRLDSREGLLPRIRREDLDRNRPDWLYADAELIQVWCPNYQSGALALYTKSPAIDTARLTVVRLPLAEMADPNEDSPEIHFRHHDGLVNWMLYRLHLKPGDLQDMDKAKAYLDLFTNEFGPASTAKQETWDQERQGYDDEGLY